jgi:hypothetical protein
MTAESPRELEHAIDQGEIDRRMALAWLMNPDVAPLTTFNEEVQRLVSILSERLPTPGLDEASRELIESRQRDEAVRKRALDIASENKARQKALEVADELDSQSAVQRVEALMNELLTTESLDDIPELPPVIEGLLYRGTVARMNGKPGAMKSFVVLDLAGHVGAGMDWCGMPVTSGTVIYVVAEGMSGIKKRVRAWEQEKGRRMTGVVFLTRPVAVAGPEWLVLQEACKTLHPVLVVIDTQARATVGIDESSNEKMSIIFDRIERLAKESNACTLLVHHTGHTGTHGRGASAMLGAVQTEITVKKEGKGADRVIVIEGEKSKDDDDEYKIRMLPKVVSVDGMAKRSGAPETSVVLVPEAQAVLCLPGLTPDATAAVRLLDEHAAPADLGRDAMRRWLREREIVSPGNTPLAAAIRHRKQRDTRPVEEPPPHPVLTD